MDELEYLESQKRDIEKRIRNEEEAAACREEARVLRAQYTAFNEAGFTDEQAWWLTAQMFLKAIGAPNV